VASVYNAKNVPTASAASTDQPAAEGRNAPLGPSLPGEGWGEALLPDELGGEDNTGVVLEEAWDDVLGVVVGVAGG